MAKALFGHIGIGTEPEMRDELQRLKDSIRALEFEVARLRADNDRLAAAVSVHGDEFSRLTSLEEPALT
ncbi:MAG: hypothetical protein ACRD3Q_12240 [Terriglobales bacterium]